MRKTVLSVLVLSCACWAQDRSSDRNGVPGQQPGARVEQPGEVPWSPLAAKAPSATNYDDKGISFTAELLNASEETAQRAADVKVDVSGIRLVDPDQAHQRAQRGQGHIEYRVDFGPVVATTATKLEFRQLPHGKHRIVVELAANDGTPLGPHQVLWLTVP